MQLVKVRDQYPRKVLTIAEKFIIIDPWGMFVIAKIYVHNHLCPTKVFPIFINICKYLSLLKRFPNDWQSSASTYGCSYSVVTFNWGVFFLYVLLFGNKYHHNANCCTFSKHWMSFSRWGFHTCAAYSRCGRTRAVSLSTVVLSI